MRMPILSASVVVACVKSTVPASAQVFQVCEGQYPRHCAEATLHIGCDNIDRWSTNVCGGAEKQNWTKHRFSFRAGGKCGYTYWEVSCIPQKSNLFQPADTLLHRQVYPAHVPGSLGARLVRGLLRF